MKHKFIKTVALFIAVLTCTLSLAACGGGKYGAGNTVSIGYSAAKFDMIIDSSDKINCDYLLVYNSAAGFAEIEACIDLLETLSNTYSAKATFQICPDTLKVPNPEQKLILLGNTTYGASNKSLSIIDSIRHNNYYDYLLRADDNLLAINWISKFGRDEAFKYLVENVFAGDLTAAFLPGYSYLYLSDRSDSPIVTIDDVNIVQYSVVIPGSPSYMERYVAEQLVRAVKDATGVEMPLVTDVVEDATYEILIGDTNRAETYVTSFFSDKRYVVAQYGSKLILRGGKIEATSTAVAHFTEMVNNALITAEPIHIKTNYCKTGNVDTYNKNVFNGYSLKYADEFDSIDINEAIWNVNKNATVGYGSAPGVMYYEPDQVDTDSRNLVITTELKNDGYTSGEVNSFNKLKFRHGYVELRAKFRTAPGLWIKFMLSNQYERGDTISQIDVFNSLASNDTIFGSVGVLSQETYYQDYLGFIEPSYEGYRSGGLQYGQLLSDAEFHTYGMEWTEEYIKFFIDGVPYGTVETTDDKYKDLQKELYLSFFVGVEMTDQAVIDEIAQWPHDFTIDWVRIYQKEGATMTFGASEPTAETTPAQ